LQAKLGAFYLEEINAFSFANLRGQLVGQPPGFVQQRPDGIQPNAPVVHARIVEPTQGLLHFAPGCVGRMLAARPGRCQHRVRQMPLALLGANQVAQFLGAILCQCLAKKTHFIMHLTERELIICLWGHLLLIKGIALKPPHLVVASLVPQFTNGISQRGDFGDGVPDCVLVLGQ
jgi:hypothetical protein